MNTTHIKKYAPLARNVFITAVTKRANELGIYDSHIEEAVEEGQVLKIEGRSVDLSLKAARNKLIQRVESTGFTALMEFIAYSWFNRLCAIRYMELHDYLDHGLRVLSHPDNDSGFEILEHAQDVAEDLSLNRDQIIELKLAGNQDELLYRTLLLGQCHKLHQAMPFLFEAIDDETELLLPDNLTRTDSILRGLVNDIPAQDWEQVEIIGWLYQFYISEKKDQVIGKVVKSEDIPAATQLFTPNWIVKYLVQNSVGRQWLQTYPDSKLVENLKEVDRKKKVEAAERLGETNTANIEGDVYYIEPAEQTDKVNAQIKTITPDSIEPESIKVLDPACGSGHILVEAYQVLKVIYEERGYQPRKIPQLILENNLFGLDIDDRAAQLAGFSLMMLARADDRRIFTRDVELNVLAMQSTAGLSLQSEECLLIQDEQQRQEFVQNIQDLLVLFEQAKTFGSLIEVPEAIADYLPIAEKLVKQLADSGDLFAQHTASTLIPIIKQAGILARKYDAVVANPPYMSSKSMNAELKDFAKKKFPDSKSDLFAIFMEEAFSLLKPYGYNAQVNMQSWMFLSSYENLRQWLLSEKTIIVMAHLGPAGFDGLSKNIVQTSCTIFRNLTTCNYKSSYDRLISYDGTEAKRASFLEAEDRIDGVNQNYFNLISGSPILYWITQEVWDIFSSNPSLNKFATAIVGLQTCNNDRYTRYWHEVNFVDIGAGIKNCGESQQSNLKWFPFNKGGDLRKWFGNNDLIVNWFNDGEEIKYSVVNNPSDPKTKHWSRYVRSYKFYFDESVSTSAIAASENSYRYYKQGGVFDVNLRSYFKPERVSLNWLLGFLNSKVSQQLISLLSPTLALNKGDLDRLPYIEPTFEIDRSVKTLIEMSEKDWDYFERSYNFSSNPLIQCSQFFQLENDNCVLSLVLTYESWQKENSSATSEMERLEVENNRLFIYNYGLEGELTSDVEMEKVSLTVNPKYRYGGNLSDEILENRFQSDTLAELIGYAIGCMMGRYSLDQEGLVYAHAGNEGFTELEQQDAYKTFPADDDGIIPLTDQEWFADDATHRFREFVRVVWGEENLQQNLDFVAESLCLHAIKAKSGESSLETIRRYLSTQFYKDHLKTYKKRPIYWLFSSGKQKAFECLVYLHRYNESTLSRMRTEYVTPLLGKYEASAMVLEKQMQDASSTAESNRFKKSLTALEKKQTELSEFDDKLKHTADMRISLDLDDGVKVNYGKFGDLLAEVKGVHGKAVK